MLTLTKIPFRFYNNCESTHIDTKFIVMTKVSLPYFCLLIFLLKTSIRFHISPPTQTHTFSQQSNIHSTDMCFLFTCTHTLIIPTSYEELWRTLKNFFNFWFLTTTTQKSSKNKFVKYKRIYIYIYIIYIYIYMGGWVCVCVYQFQSDFLLNVSSRCSFINLCCICEEDTLI